MPYNPNGTPQDVQSPTQLVLGYLASKGLQPTSANVRSALEMNAQNPGFIQGLTNQAPPPPDPAGSGGSGGRAASPGPQTSAPSQPLPTPPTPPADGGAQPPAPTAGGDGGNAAGLIASLLGAGGLGVFLNRGIQEVPKPGDAPTAGPRANPAAPSAPPQTEDSGLRLHPAQNEAPSQPQIGHTPQIEGSQNPLEAAILKALGGGEVTPQLPAPQAGQIAGPQAGVPQLPAPQPKPAIRLPDGASNPVPFPIPQGTGQLSGMGDGINWGKVLGDGAKVVKKAVK